MVYEKVNFIGPVIELKVHQGQREMAELSY